MKKLIVFTIAGFMLIGIAWGQANRYGISDAEGRVIMAMIQSNHFTRVSLAYPPWI